MTGEQMIKNIEELFGENSTFAYQIRNIFKNYGKEYANIVYEQIIYGERINVKKEIENTKKEMEELQKRLYKLNLM